MQFLRRWVGPLLSAFDVHAGLPHLPDRPGGPTSQSHGAVELGGVGNARAAVRRRAPGVH